MENDVWLIIHNLCEIKINEYYAACFGLEYCISHNKNEFSMKSIEDVVIEQYSLFLPFLKEMVIDNNNTVNDDSLIMTLLTSEWRKIDKNKSIRLKTNPF